MTIEPSEAQLQDAIVAAAQLRGYLVHHVRPASTTKGYRTPLQGDPGFPDLVIVGRGVVFVWELKTTAGRSSPAQVAWLDELADALAPAGAAADVRVIRPALLDHALRALELGAWPHD